MGYLDGAGLEYFWGKIKGKLPGPRGPAGPDGNPIGTVISFMGASAPKDYLVCDGAQYGISQYPALAAFFQTQFGTKNHFGGDGTSTFAVPDMRNLFLRGYHGEAEEQLSGEVGEKQDATLIPNIGMGPSTGNFVPAGPSPSVATPVLNKDFNSGREFSKVRVISNGDSTSMSADEFRYQYYASRPVNMAVLYCIKAVESTPADAAYSTEETRIGTWIDGKPIYRRIINITKPSSYAIPPSSDWVDSGIVLDTVDLLISSRLLQTSTDGYMVAGSNANGSGGLAVKNHHLMLASFYWVTCANIPAIAIIEYTKTTD